MFTIESNLYRAIFLFAYTLERLKRGRVIYFDDVWNEYFDFDQFKNSTTWCLSRYHATIRW